MCAVASLRTQLEAKGGEIALLNRQLLDAVSTCLSIHVIDSVLLMFYNRH